MISSTNIGQIDDMTLELYLYLFKDIKDQLYDIE